MSLITDALDKLDGEARSRKSYDDIDADADFSPLPEDNTSKNRILRLVLYVAASLSVVLALAFFSQRFLFNDKPLKALTGKTSNIASSEDNVEEHVNTSQQESTVQAGVVAKTLVLYSQSDDNKANLATTGEGFLETSSVIEEELNTADADNSISEKTEETEQLAINIAPPSREEFKEAFDTAISHQRNKDYHKALNSYKAAIKLNPDSSDSYANMATIYAEMGNYEEAVKGLKMALSVDPKNEIAHNNLGIIYLQQGKHDKALEEFRYSLTQNPDNPGSYVNFGLVCMRLGHGRDAIEAFETALQLAPAHPDAHYNYALLLDRQRDHGGAIHHYNMFVESSEGYDPQVIQQVQERILYLNETTP